jgi:hypothetical protein
MIGLAPTRRLGALAALTAALVVPLAAGRAHAEPSTRPPVGPPEVAHGPPTYSSDDDCPDGSAWREVTPSDPGHLSAAYDHNRDGEVCVRITPGGAIVFMDNVVR